MRTKKWMFANVAAGTWATDLIADSKAELIKKAKEKYNKTDAEIRGWKKNGTEPREVEMIIY